MFENGSGEVFTAARVVAFAACAVAASVPPSSAASKCPGRLIAAEHAGRAAPRRPGCGSPCAPASHSESTHGTLSARNSTTSMSAAGPTAASGCCSRCRPGAARPSPKWPARPVRNTAAYRRRPLAQPSAAARATSCAVSRVSIARARFHAERNGPRGLRQSLGRRLVRQVTSPIGVNGATP